MQCQVMINDKYHLKVKPSSIALLDKVFKYDQLIQSRRTGNHVIINGGLTK